MFCKKYIPVVIAFACILLLVSCNQIIEGVAEGISESYTKNDSLAELKGDAEYNYLSSISKEYKIIERKKSGDDTLYLVQRYYTDGAKYADMWYRNNLRDGVSVFYHRDGSPFFKIIFKNDCEYTIFEGFDTKGKALDFRNLRNGTGKLIVYDPLYDLKLNELNYKDGKKNGDYFIYYSTGEVSQKGAYVNDKLQGAFAKYYKNGKVKEKCIFYDGAIEGEHTGYFRSGKIQQMERWKNRQLEYSVEYDSKGLKIKEKTFQYKDSSQFEIINIYGNDGRLTSKGQLKDGLKCGSYSYFYDNGKPKSTEIWRNDTLVREKTWHESGNLKSVSLFNENQLDSIYTEYYKDGKLRLQQQYKNGKKDGKYVSFYSNGQKYVSGAFSNDKPLGKFQYYTKEGVYKGENEFKIPKE